MLGEDLVRKGMHRQDGGQGQAFREIIMMKPKSIKILQLSFFLF